jgi:molybdate transport system substrate-binding protein
MPSGRLRRVLAVITLAACLCAPAAVSAQALTVAAASDLQAALPALVARFEREAGRTVRVTFGASGSLFAQIQNGAPFDVFLSADIDYPRRLQDAGLTVAGTLTRYATGRLVVWTRRDSGIDLRGGLRALTAPGVRRIAIGNPDHAPYGRAAVAALRAAGIYDRVRDRLVFGENILQAAQFAQSGNADAGIIASSLARGAALREAGSFVDVPPSLHPPLDQGAVVTGSARDIGLARRFVAFLTSTWAADHFTASGFSVPGR